VAVVDLAAGEKAVTEGQPRNRNKQMDVSIGIV
jgi:hypothetical protein